MPTRYLKPGICDSDCIEAIKLPASEVFYYRLLTVVDDFGRMDARPLLLKSKCFPVKVSATEKLVSQWLADIEQAGLVKVYTVDGKPYLQILKWDNKPRASESKYPNPANADKCMQSVGIREQSHANLPVTVTVTETKTGTETDSAAKAAVSVKPRKTKLPENFGEWSPAMVDWLSENCHPDDFKTHFDYFVGYAKANGKTYVDWEQAFKNAVRDDWAKARKAGEVKSTPWWTSDALVQAKGRELGMAPRAGESWQQFKGRINERLSEKA
jgi:hypothetical protein